MKKEWYMADYFKWIQHEKKKRSKKHWSLGLQKGEVVCMSCVVIGTWFKQKGCIRKVNKPMYNLIQMTHFTQARYTELRGNNYIVYGES